MKKLRPMQPKNIQIAKRVLDGETIRKVAKDEGLHHSRVHVIVHRACLRLFLAWDFERYGKPVENLDDYRAMWRMAQC